MKEQNKKSKIKNVITKIFVVILIIVVAFVGIVVGFTAKSQKDYKKRLENLSTSTTESTTSSNIELIAITDETNYKKGTVNSTKISLSNKEYKNFIKLAESQKLGFTYDDYYLIEKELEKPYVKRGKTENKTELINDKGEIDAEKLTQVALKNAKTKKKVVLAVDIDEKKTREICELICNVCNNNKDKYDINELATMLCDLRIFEKKGSTAFAYVSQNIDFGFNSTMIDLYEKMGNVTGEEKQTEQSSFVHETMHLFQYATSYDGNNEEIDKVGFCRLDRTNDNIPHPLYDSWLVEASADTMMQSYLNSGNGVLCYQKKISYMNSVLLDFMFDKGFDRHMLERTTLSSDIYEMFDILNIKDKKEQIDFLKLLYSVEICQELDEGFFKYYAEKNGVDTAYDSNGERTKERLGLVLTCRSDLEKYIVNKFYKAFADYVKNNDVDLETVFYLARLCEIDTANHLLYSNKKYYDYQIDNIKLHYELQQGLFNAIANSSNMSLDEINNAYDDYLMYVLDENENKIPNCNSNLLTEEQKDFIEYSESIFKYDKFVRLKTVINYMEN